MKFIFQNPPTSELKLKIDPVFQGIFDEIYLLAAYYHNYTLATRIEMIGIKHRFLLNPGYGWLKDKCSITNENQMLYNKKTLLHSSQVKLS